jgi:hypothetical protein
MHLTNYAVNKESEEFVMAKDVEDILKDNMATKRTLASLYDSLGQLGVNVA